MKEGPFNITGERLRRRTELTVAYRRVPTEEWSEDGPGKGRKIIGRTREKKRARFSADGLISGVSGVMGNSRNALRPLKLERGGRRARRSGPSRKLRVIRETAMLGARTDSSPRVRNRGPRGGFPFHGKRRERSRLLRVPKIRRTGAVEDAPAEIELIRLDSSGEVLSEGKDAVSELRKMVEPKQGDLTLSQRLQRAADVLDGKQSPPEEHRPARRRRDLH